MSNGHTEKWPELSSGLCCYVRASLEEKAGAKQWVGVVASFFYAAPENGFDLSRKKGSTRVSHHTGCQGGGPRIS